MSNKAYEMWDSMKEKSYEKVIDDIDNAIEKYISKPEELLKSCFEKAGEVLHAKSGSFWLYHLIDDGLISPYAFFGDIDFTDCYYLPNEGLIGKSIENNETILLDDNSNNKDDYLDRMISEYETLMCVPIEINGMAFGTILFVDKNDGYYYDDRDLKFVKELVNRIVEILKKSNLLSRYEKVRTIDGKKFKAAVLVIDIVNRSQYNEGLNIDTLVNVIHSFCVFVSNCINDNYGSLIKVSNNKLIGYFSDNVEDPCFHAAKASKELIEKKKTISKTLKDAYDIAFNFRICVDYGEVFVGKIGNTVNLANEIIGKPCIRAIAISEIIDNDTIVLTKDVCDNISNDYSIDTEELQTAEVGNSKTQLFKLK